MSFREILREKIVSISRYRIEQVGWEAASVAADLADSLFDHGGDLNAAGREAFFQKKGGRLSWRTVESYTFPWQDGNHICLRQVYRVPEQICDIPVAGSRIHLRAISSALPPGSTSTEGRSFRSAPGRTCRFRK